VNKIGTQHANTPTIAPIRPTMKKAKINNGFLLTTMILDLIASKAFKSPKTINGITK
jgi:hypothetical protein